MLYGRPVSGELGFSLNPLHYVKKAAHDVVHPLDTAKGAANAVGHAIKTGIIKPFEWVASKVTAPIRNRVHQLRDRRAKKLAWDARKSTTPTPAEQAQAKSWTKSHLKKQGPHGEVLQLFAGPSLPMLLGSGAVLGDPVTLSIIAASIPVFMELMNAVLKKADKSGEAPANPAAAGGGGGAATPGAPGGDDGSGGGGDAGGDAGGGGGGGKHGHGGGGGPMLLGMPRKYVIIGGAVLGGVVVLSLLTSKKG